MRLLGLMLFCLLQLLAVLINASGTPGTQSVVASYRSWLTTYSSPRNFPWTIDDVSPTTSYTLPDPANTISHARYHDQTERRIKEFKLLPPWRKDPYIANSMFLPR
jgi:hypothetical protein